MLETNCHCLQPPSYGRIVLASPGVRGPIPDGKKGEKLSSETDEEEVSSLKGYTQALGRFDHFSAESLTAPISPPRQVRIMSPSQFPMEFY